MAIQRRKCSINNLQYLNISFWFWYRLAELKFTMITSIISYYVYYKFHLICKPHFGINYNNDTFIVTALLYQVLLWLHKIIPTVNICSFFNLKSASSKGKVILIRIGETRIPCVYCDTQVDKAPLLNFTWRGQFISTLNLVKFLIWLCIKYFKCLIKKNSEKTLSWKNV